MKVSTRKIIAREFLYFLGTSVFISISLLLYYFISIQVESQILTLEHQKSDLQTLSKNVPYRYRLYLLAQKNEINIDNRSPSEFIRDIGTNQKFASSFYKSFLAGAESLKIDESVYLEFVIRDVESETYLEEIDNLEGKINKLSNSFWNRYVSISDIFLSIMYGIIILFSIRYLFYCTLWSIRQLRD